MTTLFSHLSPHRASALAWIEQNPDVFLEMERIAKVYAARGQRFSVDAIGHVMRWERRFEWSHEFKVNNSHLSTVADELVRRNPELDKFCERRARGGQIRRSA